MGNLPKTFEVSLVAELREFQKRYDGDEEPTEVGELLVRAADEIEFLNIALADIHNKHRHEFEKSVQDATDAFFNKCGALSLRRRRLG